MKCSTCRFRRFCVNKRFGLPLLLRGPVLSLIIALFTNEPASRLPASSQPDTATYLQVSGHSMRAGRSSSSLSALDLQFDFNLALHS